uniref:Protein FAM32A n=1 Tax=Calcidiscus leptoporus TaxID=127549 RepID=A0A7S0NQA2_9EUKA|mmetsp:Transcript_15401/g.35451  ORF Transcript_15401/g.35451 Transcript_15401/m.35451 type:complete len:112 (+) Transcript_15401:146-481(+)
MSDAYGNVVGGGLKLKGGGIKKRKARSTEETFALSEAPAAASSSSSSAPPPPASALHTATERRRHETMNQRQMQLAEDGKLLTHRDKVRDFNKYLSSLTEHYDLPKVSKGN